MSYEFNEEQNAAFTLLTKRMSWLAIVITLGGVATIIQYIVDEEIELFIAGVLYLIMALSFYFPVDNFKRIVSTEGSDIKELSRAFLELKNGWLVVNIVTAILVIVSVWAAFK